MQYLRLVFLPLVLVACAEDLERGHRTLATTTLSGSVSLVAPVPYADICAYAFSAAAEPEAALGCTVSDARGLWTMQAGKLHDTVRIEATAPGLIAPLRAVLRQVPQFGHVSHAAIPPVTSLASGYAFYLARTGLPDDAGRDRRVVQIWPA